MPLDSDTSETILKVSNIESYYGPIMAIRGVSLSVPRGKIITVLGANGAGKTTILKTISGVLDPQKGSIEFEGKPIQRMDADKIVRLGLSHVPEGREVFPFLSVRENLAMGAFLRSDRDGVAQDLERVFAYFPRLKERIDQPAGSLSGGWKQRLALAACLLHRPRLLLLDEPFGALDPGVRLDMHALITGLWREHNLTILMVTHDIKEAFALGTRVLAFDKPRRDPHAPNRFGATITYDLKLDRKMRTAPPEDLVELIKEDLN